MLNNKDVARSECGQFPGTIPTDIRSSDMLCSADWQLFTDVSGQTVRTESAGGLFQRRSH